MIKTELVKQFYDAFRTGDAEKMVSFYHKEVVFEDPVFGKLHGEAAKNMWRMLTKRSKGNLEIGYHSVCEKNGAVFVKWEAKYSFGPQQRSVHNKVSARFEFKDYLIVKHTDKFSFWRWSRMALGAAGVFLGFTPIVKNKVKAQAKKSLEEFSAKRNTEIQKEAQ